MPPSSTTGMEILKPRVDAVCFDEFGEGQKTSCFLVSQSVYPINDLVLGFWVIVTVVLVWVLGKCMIIRYLDRSG